MFYTIYVNNYSIKFSFDEKHIHISMPLYREDLDIKDPILSDIFRKTLIQYGWKNIAVTALNNYIRNSKHFIICRMNTKTGKITERV